MSDLSLTYTLTAGQPENVNHVQQNFADIRTWANDGVISDDNFAATAGMYTAYRTVAEVGGSYLASALTAGDHLLVPGGLAVLEATSGSDVSAAAFYLDDADYAIAGRTLKLRLRAQLYTNATAPAITATFGLFPVSSVAGSTSATAITLGAVTAGSTVAFATPALSTANQGNSGDFAFPADGHYALGVTLSGAPAANSRTLLNAQLQQRWT